MYYNGEGVRQHYSKAAEWYRRSAEQIYADAQFNLSLMYYNGEGVHQDYAEAAMWARHAAEQGHADAQFLIGTMYELGRGVLQDDEQGAMWLRRSAEQGNASAQYFVGVKYYSGWGVPQNHVQAHKWLSLAIARLPESDLRDEAIEQREKVTMRLSASQLAYSQRLAREWQPKYEQEDSASSTLSQLDVADLPDPNSAHITTGSFT